MNFCTNRNPRVPKTTMTRHISDYEMKSKTSDHSKSAKRTRPPVWAEFHDHYAIVTRWLLRNYFSEADKIRLGSLGYAYVKKLCKIIKHRGLKEGIRLHKDVRNLVYTFWAGGKAEPVKGTSLTFDGLPKILGDLVSIIRSGDTVTKRYLSTILYSTRSLLAPVAPNLNSITTQASVDKFVLEDCRKHIPSFWRALGVHRPLSLDKIPRFSKFHMSTKSGPNTTGINTKCTGNALITSLLDAWALRNYPDLLQSIGVVGGQVLLDKLKLIQEWMPTIGPWFWPKKKFIRFSGNDLNLRIRKVSAIQDYECKTRIVAILDYWSQTCLRPLHTWLFSILRKIPQDCTFDQNSFKGKMRDSKFYVSADLKDATDRFPIILIGDILEFPMGREYADHWMNIMTGYPFPFKDQGEVRYHAGNPMGAYSSWNSFALSHHFVLYYSCQILGRDWHKCQYCLLGDDIVIGDREVADMYIQILTALGVEVSALKTHRSEHTYEFAKRWIHHGEEISPFPVAGLLSICNRYNLMVNLLQTSEEKGYLPSLGVPEAIKDWYLLKKLRRRYSSDILEKSILSDCVTRVLTKKCKEGDCLKIITRLCDWPDLIEHFQDGGKYLFQQAAIVAFTNAADPKSGWNLGSLAEELVCRFTDPSFCEDIMVGFELIQSLPVLNLHGQITETYLDLKKQALSIDQGKLGAWDWPLVLRSMTIPISDRVYTARNYQVMVEAAASVSLGLRVVRLLKDFFGLDDPKPRFLKRMLPKAA